MNYALQNNQNFVLATINNVVNETMQQDPMVGQFQQGIQGQLIPQVNATVNRYLEHYLQSNPFNQQECYKIIASTVKGMIGNFIQANGMTVPGLTDYVQYVNQMQGMLGQQSTQPQYGMQPQQYQQPMQQQYGMQPTQNQYGMQATTQPLSSSSMMTPSAMQPPQQPMQQQNHGNSMIALMQSNHSQESTMEQANHQGIVDPNPEAYNFTSSNVNVVVDKVEPEWTTTTEANDEFLLALREDLVVTDSATVTDNIMTAYAAYKVDGSPKLLITVLEDHPITLSASDIDILKATITAETTIPDLVISVGRMFKSDKYGLVGRYIDRKLTASIVDLLRYKFGHDELTLVSLTASFDSVNEWVTSLGYAETLYKLVGKDINSLVDDLSEFEIATTDDDSVEHEDTLYCVSKVRSYLFIDNEVELDTDNRVIKTDINESEIFHVFDSAFKHTTDTYAINLIDKSGSEFKVYKQGLAKSSPASYKLVPVVR